MIKKQKGQSLLETIFAIAILLVVVIAVLGLSIGNIFGQKANEQQVIANNLARESIEMIRSFRDSNWLSGDSWDKNFEQSGTGIVGVLSSSVDYSGSVPEQLYFDTFFGMYFHSANPGSSITSPYSRRVEIEFICLPSFGEEIIRSLGEPCLIGETKIGAKISSIVTWNERGENRQVSLEDLIYDWK